MSKNYQNNKFFLTIFLQLAIQINYLYLNFTKNHIIKLLLSKNV